MLTCRKAPLGTDHSPHPTHCLFPQHSHNLPSPGEEGDPQGPVLAWPVLFVRRLPCLQTEAPLLIRPYLADMTLSEIHVVMTGGYATIAGSLLGSYISFGV